MIVVTGAAGFIGSCLIRKINEDKLGDILAVDDFSDKNKLKNLEGKIIKQFTDRKEFIKNPSIAGKPDFIFHIGARTDTAEFDYEVLNNLNTLYTQKLWNYCVEHQVPLIYASSAATYGLGENGFDDDLKLLEKLKPLNPYGQSKHDFDLWAVKQSKMPPFWAGLKFFNVYGPNEYHKNRMASVVLHGTKQIKETGIIRLFKSYRNDYKDGEQKRDFIYVKDLLDVLIYFYKNRPQSSIYNLGTGKANTWNQLASAIFKALEMPENIEYIDMPADIKDKYQYFTEAKIDKLVKAGYNKSFMAFDDAVGNYIKNYITKGLYY